MKNQTLTTPAQDDTVTGLVLEGINLQLFAEEPPAGDPPADPLADPPVSGDPPADPPANNDPPADPPANDPPVGAPEAYTDYTLPEGIEYNKEFASAFNDVAKELNLTQAQAQRLVDLQAGNVKMSMDLQAKQNADWVAGSMKEHGEEGIEQANKTLARFSTPEYVAYLTESGQGNNPAVIAQWRKVAEMVSEDKSVNANSHGSTKTIGELLYPTMK